MSIFSLVFAKIADGRQQTTCGEQSATGRTMYVRVRAVYSLYGDELLFLSYLSRVIVLLLPRPQYVPHPTPHVPLLASWRTLSWSSNCDALIHIIRVRCKSFVCYQVVLCIFSRTDQSWARLYRVYPKSAKSTAIENAQEVLLCW